MFLELLWADASAALEPALRAMGATWEQFGEMVRTVGEVRVLRRDGTLVGYAWIEQRSRELHVHGLALVPEMRGRGIGTRMFSDLEAEFGDRVDVVELGVHESNADARRLYERLGFRTARTLPDVGFIVLRKPLRG